MQSPDLGAPLAPAHPSEEAVRMLRLRRSCPADMLSGPGPDAETLEAILTIAARVPDHRRVTPYRFIVFADEARVRFGGVLKDAFLANEPDAEARRVDYEEQRFLRAPVVVAVVSSIDPAHRTPEWEQVLSAGAVCQNMLLAASAHGFAAQWLTEWYAYDANVIAALGLGEHERIAGFVYLGTAREDPKERARADLKAITAHF